MKAVLGFLARPTVLKRHHGYRRLITTGFVVELTDVSQSFAAAPHTVLSAERGLARSFTAVGLGRGAVLQVALFFLHLFKVLDIAMIRRVSRRTSLAEVGFLMSLARWFLDMTTCVFVLLVVELDHSVAYLRRRCRLLFIVRLHLRLVFLVRRKGFITPLEQNLSIRTSVLIVAVAPAMIVLIMLTITFFTRLLLRVVISVHFLACQYPAVLGRAAERHAGAVLVVEGVAARRPVRESLILEETLVPPVENNVPDRHYDNLDRLHGD